MRTIYHMVPADQWDNSDPEPYRAASLATEGFIHCSNREQLARVANWFYSDQRALVVLHLNVDLLSSPVRDEDAGTGERFPHIYGPINREAIFTVEPLRRDPEGRWIF